MTSPRLIKITYWKGYTEYNVWWFEDQIERAMTALGADRWRVPAERRG